jgi:autotransporter-associated beta strand protein
MRLASGHVPAVTRPSSPARAAGRCCPRWIALAASAFALFAVAPYSATAQTSVYWDINGSGSAAGGTSPTGTWSTGTANWSTSSAGNVSTSAWTNGNIAIFSAGTTATGSYTVTVSGNVTTASITIQEGTPTFSVGASDSLTVTGLISSTVGLTKSGAGTMTIGNATNTFTGNTTVTGGTLRLSSSNALSANSTLIISSGATVDFDWGHSATVAGLSGAGTLDIKNTTLTIGGTDNTTFSGTITDSGGYGGIVKNGTGTLTLSGANSFDGQINITAGVVNLQNSNALGGSTYGNTIGSGAALQLQGGITVNEGSFNLNGSGISSTGAFRSLSGNNTFTGAVVLQSSSTIGVDAGTLNLTGDVNLGSSQTLTLVGNGSLNLSGAVYGSGSGITQTGNGTTTFSGSTSNSFGGTLNIDSGTIQFNKTGGAPATNGGAINIGNGVGAANSATLTLLASNQIPDSSALITINSDGRFNLNNQSETINTIAGTGSIDLGASGYLGIGVNSGSSTFGGSITGTGTFEKLGSGTLTFNSSINFSGTLLLSGGTLALNGYNLTVGTLHITGDSILDFGNSSASTLNATNFIIDAGVTLTINNWVSNVDFFYAQSWSGASHSTSGSTPTNQIAFTGYSSNSTNWQSYDNQITPISPVPEPATYGALLLAFATSITLWRRRQA